MSETHQQRESLFDRIFQLETENQDLQLQVEKSLSRERELKKQNQVITLERDSTQGKEISLKFH
jgi:hypothetical protein